MPYGHDPCLGPALWLPAVSARPEIEAGPTLIAQRSSDSPHYGVPLELRTWRDERADAQRQQWMNVLLSMDIRDHLPELAVGVVLAGAIAYAAARVANPGALAALLKLGLGVSGGVMAIQVDEWLAAARDGDIDKARARFAQLAGTVGPLAARALRRYVANLWSGATPATEDVAQTTAIGPLLPDRGRALVPTTSAVVEAPYTMLDKYGNPVPALGGGSRTLDEMMLTDGDDNDFIRMTPRFFDALESLPTRWQRLNKKQRFGELQKILSEQLARNHVRFVKFKLVSSGELVSFDSKHWEVWISPNSIETAPDSRQLHGQLAALTNKVVEYWNVLLYASRSRGRTKFVEQNFSIEVARAVDKLLHDNPRQHLAISAERTLRLFTTLELKNDLDAAVQRHGDALGNYRQAPLDQRIQSKGDELQNALDERRVVARHLDLVRGASHASQAAHWAEEQYDARAVTASRKPAPAARLVPRNHENFNVDNEFYSQMRDLRPYWEQWSEEQRCQQLGIVLNYQLKRFGAYLTSVAVADTSHFDCQRGEFELRGHCSNQMQSPGAGGERCTKHWRTMA